MTTDTKWRVWRLVRFIVVLLLACSLCVRAGGLWLLFPPLYGIWWGYVNGAWFEQDTNDEVFE